MPPAPRHQVWKHFADIDKADFKAPRKQCIYCGHQTSAYSIQRAQKHLRQCHLAIQANQVPAGSPSAYSPSPAAASHGVATQSSPSSSSRGAYISPAPISRPLSHALQYSVPTGYGTPSSTSFAPVDFGQPAFAPLTGQPMSSAHDPAAYGVIMNKEERESPVPLVESRVSVDDGGDAGPGRMGMVAESDPTIENDKPDTLIPDNEEYDDEAVAEHDTKSKAALMSSVQQLQGHEPVLSAAAESKGEPKGENTTFFLQSSASNSHEQSKHQSQTQQQLEGARIQQVAQDLHQAPNSNVQESQQSQQEAASQLQQQTVSQSQQVPVQQATSASLAPMPMVLTSTQIEELYQESLKARENAYCPYSHFRVGASLLTKDGRHINGANVENAAYPSGTCAERCALSYAVGSMGLRRGAFVAIGVITDLTKASGGPASPCGMCRQVMREFFTPEVQVYMFYSEGGYVMKTMEELLPMSFGPDTLPPPEALDQMQAGR